MKTSFCHRPLHLLECGVEHEEKLVGVGGGKVVVGQAVGGGEGEVGAVGVLVVVHCHLMARQLHKLNTKRKIIFRLSDQQNSYGSC